MTTRKVRSGELCRLISIDLSQRWLGELSFIQRRLRNLTGSRAAWINKLATAIHRKYGVDGHCRQAKLYLWLRKQDAIKQGFGRRKSIDIKVAAASAITQPSYLWQVPRASGEGQLADLLCLRSTKVLDWLLQPHRRRETKVDHYNRNLIPRHNGKKRLIHQPRPVLMRVQRIIHEQILPAIPVHDAAHAYRPGRSVHTCAQAHVNKFVVLRMDLADFFGTITLRRVSAIFRRAGYDRETSLALGRLCTVPADQTVPDARRIMAYLPQGAPTSPSLANAVAFQLDRRLSGLANCCGAAYTRYADDLYFSGDSVFAAKIDRFATSVAAIVMEEGFAVNHYKTRKMFHGHRQNVLGLTVNKGINSNRQHYEQLKAILHNCHTQDWRSQNLDNHEHFSLHLRGRIADIARANPNRANKLMQVYASINWD